MRPFVYIIGAGPGAPDLISVRGLRALQAADVVIHDRGVHPRLLELAAAGAERIDVGSAAAPGAGQDAINFLVAEKARDGHVVARLKSGDPFLFDRGGAEALFLREQRLGFEVIPGITSLAAAPAFAGIPLTHQGTAETVTFVRIADDDTRRVAGMDWPGLARLPGTLVCALPARQVAAVAAALVAHGRPADEMAAFVVDGTLSSQHTVVATLAELAARPGRPAPAGGVLVAGAVAGLRDRLRWFDNRPLFGRRILVTRSRAQAPELVDLLELNGAEAVVAPVLHIRPPSDARPLEQAAAAIRAFDWIVLTSANAAAALLTRVVDSTRDLRALAGPRICAVGPGTASRLLRAGVRADVEPADHRPAGVVAALGGAALAGARVLLLSPEPPGDTFGRELGDAGADVTEVAAYRAATVESDSHLGIYRELLDQRIDAVTFTSATTVRAFVEIYGAEQAPDLLAGTTVATIGPAAAEAAALAGIRVNVATEGATVAVLVEGLIRHFRR